MRSITKTAQLGLTVLCFASNVRGGGSTRDAEDFVLTEVYDFSGIATSGKICDLKVGYGVSLIDCGTSFTTFNTLAAFKDEGSINSDKETTTFSYLQRYGYTIEGSGFQYVDETDDTFNFLFMDGDTLEKESYSFDSVQSYINSQADIKYMGLLQDMLVI